MVGFAATVTESKPTELCCCLHICSHELICVRKTKLLCSGNFPQSYKVLFAQGKRNFIASQYEIYIYRLQTRAVDSVCADRKILDNEVHNEDE